MRDLEKIAHGLALTPPKKEKVDRTLDIGHHSVMCGFGFHDNPMPDHVG